jgi:lipopolysaccharide export system permease protein
MPGLMTRLSKYVLTELISPTALFALLMTTVVWLTQSLRLLDLVINRGQSAPTFVYLTFLILPSLLVVILPIAFFAGTLYALNKLSTDSELVVMWASGYSRSQLALPVFIAAGIVMAATYLCSLYLMPAGQRAVNEKVFDIRADIGAALLNPGEFNTPAKGLTVFIRSLDSDGHLANILVHDSRSKARPITYLASSGQLAQTPTGARLIMYEGTIQDSGKNGAQLSVLKFKSYAFDLDQFSSRARTSGRDTNELFLPELLYPDNPKLSPKLRNAYFAEAHNRLTAPLYCIMFALIALMAVVQGRRTRGANALRLTMASLAAATLRIAGYGVQGMAIRKPYLVSLFYIIPLLGSAAALAGLAGFDPLAWFRRMMPTSPAGEAEAAS